MSAIPSLSVWSSLKIPLTEYYGRSWNNINSPAPYMSSRKSIKQLVQRNNCESTRKVVNLRVPSPFRKDKENSLSEMTCACPDAHKKAKSHRHFLRKQNASCSCVPKSNLGSQKNSCPYHGLSYEDSCDDLRLPSDENLMDSDLEVEFDYIPSVKPWTSEELLMLNKRYRLTEEGAKTSTDKNRKLKKRKIKTTKSEQTTPKTPNKAEYLNSYKSHKSLSQNTCRKAYDIEDYDLSSSENLYNDFFSNADDSIARCRELSCRPATPAGRDYYETKLAELYMIELGIKR